MTSTPTACPKCGRLPDFCDHREIVATQLAEPRQPDTSARDAAADAYATTKRKWSQDGERFTHEEHAQGIGLSICPSTAKAFRKGADWGHARAIKEMGAEVERLQKLADSQIAYATRLECELKAAKTLDALLSENGEVIELQEQLAAAQNVIDELELNESKMNGALSAKQEQLAAAQGEIERLNRECISTFLHEQRITVANKRADAYEALIEHAIELGHLGEGSTQNWAREVLAAHRRGGES